jgi:diguanylate cyclase (GGDEF)-like protein
VAANHEPSLKARLRSSLNPISAYVLGGGFVAFAVILASPVSKLEVPLGLVLALMTLYYVAFNTEFVSWGGSAVPTEPVLIGLLFLMPIRLVPLCVLFAIAVPWPFGRRTDDDSNPPLRRAAIKVIAGWHSAGPVAVLMIAGVHPVEYRRWPVYLLAFAAQYVVEVATAVVRLYSLRLPIRFLVRPMSWTMAIDALLAPLALASVLSMVSSWGEVLLLATPVALMRVLATDRNGHIENTATARSEARLDALTGLANRRAWYESVAAMGAATDDVTNAVTNAVTIVVADLDRLKVANDTLGHQVGDQLIIAMAQVLRENAPTDALCARLGGDEFGVAVVRPITEPTAESLIAAIRAGVERQPTYSGFTLSASLGASSCPPGTSVTVAEQEADRAAGLDKRLRKMGRSTD